MLFSQRSPVGKDFDCSQVKAALEQTDEQSDNQSNLDTVKERKREPPLTKGSQVNARMASKPNPQRVGRHPGQARFEKGSRVRRVPTSERIWTRSCMRLR